MKHLLIINPAAGVKDSTEKILEEAKKVFENCDMEYHVTVSKGDTFPFIKNYLTSHQDENVRIYSCGGDGTMNDIANGMVGFSNCELAVYPSGSGNDFLKAFIDKDIFKSLEELKNGDVISIDLIKAGERYAVNEFNIGFDANVVVKQAKIKRWPLVSGKLAYDIGVLSAFLGKIRGNYKITIDGKVVFEGVGILGAVMNGGYYGGGYLCAPKAKMNDGLLDLCFIKNLGKMKFLSLLSDYKQGRHLEEDSKAKPYVVYNQGKEIRIEIDKEWPYSVDGEILYTKDITINVVPNAIKVVVPKNDKLK